MRLFGNYNAVKLTEENIILFTKEGYIYFTYNPQYNVFRKYARAGWDSITVCNYPDPSKEEVVEALGGIFPSRETDFFRLCSSDQLCISDMLDVLKEDYPRYTEDYSIYKCIHRILLDSNVCSTSYEKIKKLLDEAVDKNQSRDRILAELKSLSFSLIGRDIFKREIGIVDGHDSSSYFWIMPVRILDYKDTDCTDYVAEMRSSEISIEEDDVAQYLTPFLYKYFDPELEANKKRVDNCWTNELGEEEATYVSEFEWYLTHNYFTFESIRCILRDMTDTIDALSSGRQTEYTDKLKIKRGMATCELIYAKDLSSEQIKEYNDNRPKEDDTEAELIIDFYNRFIYRMEYMLRVGEEKGYSLISFMGP